tara:strand:+ start:514 stop:1146 length:633 start_codon:yes stop_codon:yes gene_type:complete
MNNTNEWFYFTDGLDQKICTKIRHAAKGNWEQSTVDTKKDITESERITGAKNQDDIDKKIRTSDIAWTSEQWIYDAIWPFMEEANKRAGWKYDITGAEGLQITRYKKGGFYCFHRDGKGDHLSAYDMPDKEFLHGNVRKLSMTVLLNDNYEGGEFQFATYNKEKCEISVPEVNKIGSIVVFPSYMEHGVSPVTKGTRHSLVAWFLGPPFK